MPVAECVGECHAEHDLWYCESEYDAEYEYKYERGGNVIGRGNRNPVRSIAGPHFIEVVHRVFAFGAGQLLVLQRIAFFGE